jgi:UDP-N-acetyl-D-mannosaminuronic acid dehydrogenase
MKKISIVGLGYIGLPTAVVAAQAGYDVFGFDVDHEKINRINTGDSTIFEPEIADRLWYVLSKGTFKAFTDLQYADCFVIAVPTPFKSDKTADLSFVFKAGEFVARRLMHGNLVILESTVPVGTTERLSLLLEEMSGLRVGVDFFVAYCPERVLPGKIFKELIDNDRVIGGICQKACELARLFYSKFVKGFLHITDDKTAEMVKLIENSSRDVQIALANQIAAMCATAGIDPFQVIDLANRHPRVKLLSPGCGVGGHCIAVDPYFLIERFPYDTALLKTAREVNETKPYQIIEKVLNKVAELKSYGVEKPNVLALGLTFKPDIDDYRESPALKIALELNKHKEDIDFFAYDHNLSKDTLVHFELEYVRDLWRSIKNADIILILVKHKEFCFIRDEMLENKVVIDPCGLMHDIYTKRAKAFLEGAVKFNCDTEKLTQ